MKSFDLQEFTFSFAKTKYQFWLHSLSINLVNEFLPTLKQFLFLGRTSQNFITEDITTVIGS